MNKRTDDFIAKHNDFDEKKDQINNIPTSGNDLRDFRQSMSMAFLQTQIKLEHIVYLDKKRWSESHELSSWVFGSPDRQMVFWMMAIDPIGEGFSPKMAGEYLQRDRTSVSKELTAMHDLNLIFRNPKEGFQRYYLPTQRLLDAALWFAEYYVDTTLRLTEERERRDFFEYRASERLYFKSMQKRGGDAQ